MGILYDVSLTALITFSVIAQLAAVPILLLVKKNPSDVLEKPRRA